MAGRTFLTTVLAVVVGCWFNPRLTQAAPERVVSLNPCLDTILVTIAPREQIAGLSHWAADPQRSTIASIARSYPMTYETAEEIVLLKPDMVLASRHSSLATRNALQRLGVPVRTYSVPDSIESSLQQVLDVAADIGRDAEGQELVARIRRELAAAATRHRGPPVTAAIYQPAGLTAGPDTLPGELMRIASFENIAGTRYGIAKWQPLSLEQLIASPPQVLLAEPGIDSATTQAERLMNHRALSALDPIMLRAAFPARLLYCGGPVILDALAALQRARESWDQRDSANTSRHKGARMRPARMQSAIVR
jgi:iron complex transport system substrate-binding protein